MAELSGLLACRALGAALALFTLLVGGADAQVGQGDTSNSFSNTEIAQAKQMAIDMIEVFGDTPLSQEQKDAIGDMNVQIGDSQTPNAGGGFSDAITVISEGDDPSDGEYVVTVYVFADVILADSPDPASRIDFLAFVLAHEVWHDPEIGGGSGGQEGPLEGPGTPGEGSTSNGDAFGCSCDHIGQAYWDIGIICDTVVLVSEISRERVPLYCRKITNRLFVGLACADVALDCKEPEPPAAPWPGPEDKGPKREVGDPPEEVGGWGFPDHEDWLPPLPGPDTTEEEFLASLCAAVQAICPACTCP